MRIQNDPGFIEILKDLNVRVRKSYKERIVVFQKDPYHPSLHNHEAHSEYEGLRSIDITNDYRALYEKVGSKDDPIAYFWAIGTHRELYVLRVFKIEFKNKEYSFV